MNKNALILFSFLVMASACITDDRSRAEVPAWSTYEISLTSSHDYSNPYTDVDVWAVFENETGDSLLRPAFWDGGNRWKIRFAPPAPGTTWRWTSHSSKMDDTGLEGLTGTVTSLPERSENKLRSHGFPRMSNGRRNVVLADGTPFLIVGDTPWSIPFRATIEQVEEYARDREEKGFNLALLMSVQPDQFAEGPEARNTAQGFARGFADLHQGHLNQLKPEYFQYLDSLVNVLVDHGIVPVFQPVFHGYGWKGKTVLGPTADPKEYARYCRYLVARYGSGPAFWLIGADADGLAPGVEAGGKEIEKWDAYKQPTGIHYNPCDNWLAPWAGADSSGCFHYNRSHQAEQWLDFQWAQSGHGGEHLHYKVREMYDNKPTKAVANGEPTYEGMGGGQHGLGWWQGQNAWMELMHGGTMGVVYGAASLWQWKVTADEEGWPEWTDQPKSWNDAMQMEGSRFVGHVATAFRGFDYTDMERRWDLTTEDKPLLAVEGKFYVSYLENGGSITIKNMLEGLPYVWFDPRNGTFGEENTTSSDGHFTAPDNEPWVLLIGRRNS